MALKSTVFRVELAVSDLDRHYYADHSLTLARHPAETDLRMMVRLVAFARHAHPDLRFGRGLCQDEEPDLWRREADGTVRLWVTLGQPDPRRLRKACGHAGAVVVYTYQPRAARVWWEQHGEELAQLAGCAYTTCRTPPRPAWSTWSSRAWRSPPPCRRTPCGWPTAGARSSSTARRRAERPPPAC